MEEEKLMYELSPKFNFVYELFMPTGRKIKNSLVSSIIFTVLTILICSNIFGGIASYQSIIAPLKIVSIVATIFSYAFLVVTTLLKIYQYKYITYKFYENHMVYEDTFLNQHKKNISYDNVKEVEIRRTIWDRILNFGVVIIHTNAENGRANGVVVYGIKNPDEKYKKIDEIIHRKDVDGTN